MQAECVSCMLAWQKASWNLSPAFHSITLCHGNCHGQTTEIKVARLDFLGLIPLKFEH